MLIVGAGGFALETFEVLNRINSEDKYLFFDDVSKVVRTDVKSRFEVLNSIEEVLSTLGDNFSFALGVGGPKVRKVLFEKFTKAGGVSKNIICPSVIIGSFNNYIGCGVSIMSNTVITSNVKIGDGVLVNLSCTIGHDVEIGNFTEMCPKVSISGGVKIGENVFIGTGAIILPGLILGNNSIIGAGAVVTKNVPDNKVVKGNPAK